MPESVSKDSYRQIRSMDPPDGVNDFHKIFLRRSRTSNLAEIFVCFQLPKISHPDMYTYSWCFLLCFNIVPDIFTKHVAKFFNHDIPVFPETGKVIRPMRNGGKNIYAVRFAF